MFPSPSLSLATPCNRFRTFQMPQLDYTVDEFNRSACSTATDFKLSFNDNTMTEVRSMRMQYAIFCADGG
jgi:hypothetical protein